MIALDLEQTAKIRAERMARNKIVGPLSMSYYDDKEYGRIFVAIGKDATNNWAGLWFTMDDRGRGQHVNRLPSDWSEKEAIDNVIRHARMIQQDFIDAEARRGRP